ncbi:MAG: hypothetical protein U5L05_01185 [Rubrivivax sp.]|nr:hypothetical protein [Rubrivivax sp.]
MQPPIRRALPLARAFEPATRPEPRAAGPGALRVAALCVAALLAAPVAFGQTSRYDAAHVDYEIGHYEQAFAVFASMADEGHCEAARLARQMARYGRPVYAVDFKVAPERLERWQRLPACPVTVAGHSTEPRAP